MNVTYDYAGCVAIVTGAARGVGRSLVHAFVTTGAQVVAADRDADGLAETCADLPPGTVAPVVADVSAEDGAAAIAGTATSAFGRLDFCVNNAAVAPHAALLDERAEVWDTVYAVNCRGTFLMTQAAARVLIAQGGGGRIVNFSSGVSQRGSAGAAAYASSRAATEAFSRVAAIELAVHDILVTCVSPGLIDTQPKPLPPSMAASLKNRIPALPLARPGEPSEVADVVLWLCSPGSSYVTGSIVHVDGGTGVGSRAGHEIVDEDVRYDWVTGRRR
jgi:NAD(P)-dependent dehydrogenase (short-subunit alcohol dehydrogenase family)